MELSDVSKALDEIAEGFKDLRLNVFEVEAGSLVENKLHLRGRVLEESNRQVLISELVKRFPDLTVDVEGVDVVRQAEPTILHVSTNLTSMHSGTSFLAVMLTQMLNGLPLEVLWREDKWCFVRQMDGYLGWTYEPYLASDAAPQATHLVTAPVGLLRSTPQTGADLVTRVLGGTAVCVGDMTQGWAHLNLAGGMHGWLPAEDLRNLFTLPGDAAARREQLVKDAFSIIGVPYLWGGTSANGIDCSGFAQLLHRWIGLTIPRDADMQFTAGQAIEPPFQPGDLLFFGEAGEERRITHVTVSLGGWRVIHSSRSRNGVQVDDVQQVAHLRDSYLCAATYIGK